MAESSNLKVNVSVVIEEYKYFLLNEHFNHIKDQFSSDISPLVIMKPTGFAQLEPAYTVMAYVTGANQIGNLSDGSRHDHYELNAGSITTIEGYGGPKLEGQIVNGGDWLSIDPSGKHARVNVKTVVKTAQGSSIGVNWTGHCAIDDKINAIFLQQADAATTPFGNVVSSAMIEGPGLDEDCFVGSGRFVLADGKMAVETCISRVVAPQEI